MKVRRVTWEIGELAAPGSANLNRDELQDAAQTELGNLIGCKGVPSWLSSPKEVEGFTTTDSPSKSAVQRAGLGQLLARALFGGPRS